MHWPEQPIESTPPESFVPPFCPHPKCADHRDRAARFHQHGRYRRNCDGRDVPRFRCKACKHTCSLQTFACSYYLKRPQLAPRVAAQLNAGAAHRQIARSLGCAPATVGGLAARLGRHALLLAAKALEHLPVLGEPVVVDHFETFAYSQDFPFGIATVVGQQSWFVYALDPAPHRRGGRLTSFQRKRSKNLIQPSRVGGYRASFRRCLDLLAPRIPAKGRLPILSDAHRSYGLALASHAARARFEHLVFPNPMRGPKGSPRSAYARLRDGAMFSNDLLHLLTRHSLAHHRRETIAFGRRLNALMERMFLLAAWRNFVKGRSERKPDGTTPAMALKLAQEPWSWQRVLAQRLFPSRCVLPPAWIELYRREWVTPAVGNNRRHQLRRAF